MKKKKILIIQMIILIVITMVLNMTIGISKTYAAATIKQGIDNFPESYKSALRQLASLHSNWNFTAYYTGLTWNEVINGEMSNHKANTIKSDNPAYIVNNGYEGDKGYHTASRGVLEHYMDPRNFLTETGIFQFMEMSYNPNVHNKQGVENILKGSFMDASITVTAERVDSSIKAKQKEAFIYVTPETKNTEVASAIGMNEFKITNLSGKTVDNNSNSVSGYNFINTKYNTSYTMIVMGDVNCDGQITPSDYVKVKNYIMGKSTLDNIQKKSADVNGDGNITPSDYVKIKNHIMRRTTISIEEVTTQKTTMRYADIIIKAAEESGISPYSIATKIIQEVGRDGKSNAVTGKCPGYEGYYNFYNWGASDGAGAVERGLQYAKGKGWNNQYTAIVEGAKQLADNYVSIGQNTAYFYKFNVVTTTKPLYTHQYMTNVQDPSSQARSLYNTYSKNDILDLSLNFVIPVYDNMPNQCLLPSSIDQSASTSYYINGTDVQFRTGVGTNHASMGSFAHREVVTLLVGNAGNANGLQWSKVKRENGAEGYVATTYLTKCGT